MLFCKGADAVSLFSVWMIVMLLVTFAKSDAFFMAVLPPKIKKAVNQQTY